LLLIILSKTFQKLKPSRQKRHTFLITSNACFAREPLKGFFFHVLRIKPSYKFLFYQLSKNFSKKK